MIASLTDALWTSPDGITWTKAVDGPGFGPVVSGRVTDIFGANKRVTSTDGLTWQAEALPGLPIATGASAARLADGRTVITGLECPASCRTYGGTAPSVVVYLAPPSAFAPGASAPPLTSPAPSSTPAASTSPAPSPAPSASAPGSAVSDPLCDPFLTAAEVEQVTGATVIRELGSVFDGATSCHYTIGDGGGELILALEPGAFSGRRAQLDGTGKPRSGLGKDAYLGSVGDGPVLLWGSEARTTNRTALTLGGGGFDADTLVLIAKAVRTP